MNGDHLTASELLEPVTFLQWLDMNGIAVAVIIAVLLGIVARRLKGPKRP